MSFETISRRGGAATEFINLPRCNLLIYQIIFDNQDAHIRSDLFASNECRVIKLHDDGAGESSGILLSVTITSESEADGLGQTGGDKDLARSVGDRN